MKRSLAILLGMALFACKGASDGGDAPAPAAPGPQGPPETAEKEPNNDTKSAQPVAADTRLKGSFHAKDDDWFRLEPASPTVVRVELAATGADASLELYDADKNRTLRASGDGSVTLPNVTCTARCWIKASTKTAAETPYELTFTLTAPGPRTEREPNQRAVDAQPLALGAAIDGYLAPADDEDWYLLTPAGLQPEQVIEVHLASPPDVRCELTVARTSDQAPLATYRAAEPGQDLRLRNLAAPEDPETGYYLVVRSAPVPIAPKKSVRVGNAKIAYTLEAKAAAGAPNLETEPNDDPAHATPIQLADGQAARNAFLAPRGDTDWFLFHVDAPSIVRADVTGLDRVNLVLSIIDPEKKNADKGNELARSDMGDVKEPESLAGVAVPAGDNYLRVDTAWKKVDDRFVKDFENTTDTYTITLHVDPDDGTWEREPNDKADKATPIELGNTYQGFIQPVKDVDAWQLTVAETTTVAFSVGPVPRLDLVIVLRDGSGTIIGTADKNRLEADERLVAPLEPGRYTVEIRDKATGTNPMKPYTLTVK